MHTFFNQKYLCKSRGTVTLNHIKTTAFPMLCTIVDYQYLYRLGL